MERLLLGIIGGIVYNTRVTNLDRTIVQQPKRCQRPYFQSSQLQWTARSECATDLSGTFHSSSGTHLDDFRADPASTRRKHQQNTARVCEPRPSRCGNSRAAPMSSYGCSSTSRKSDSAD